MPKAIFYLQPKMCMLNLFRWIQFKQFLQISNIAFKTYTNGVKYTGQFWLAKRQVWNCWLPFLSQLSIAYLNTPVSIVPVERLFSIAGTIFRPERCSISDKKFENIMIIKCNNDILSLKTLNKTCLNVISVQ